MIKRKPEKDTFSELMVLLGSSTTISSGPKMVAVLCALGMPPSFQLGLQSITITIPVKSEGPYVPVAIIEYSDGTEIVAYSDEWPSTSLDTLVSLFQPELNLEDVLKEVPLLEGNVLDSN